MVLPLLVFVRTLADFVALKEQDLRDAFVGVDAARQRRGVGDFERGVAFPLRVEAGDIDDDAAARVGGLPDGEPLNVSGNPEVLHSA